jgi:hypothetical protein
MKHIFALLIIICVLLGCQDSAKPLSDKKESLREVGSIIEREDADRWRSQFELKSSASRQQSSFVITKASVQELVNSLDDYDGIYFHHAIEGDKRHILVVPYKDGQSLWNTSVVIDANSDTVVDAANSSRWAENYVSQNPDGPWSHFFGRNVFEEILSNEAFYEMEIVPAINDASLPQLLLYVSYLSRGTNGRAQAQVDVYDHSNQCPPFCSGVQ